MAIALVSVTQTTAVIAEVTLSSSAMLLDLGQSPSWDGTLCLQVADNINNSTKELKKKTASTS